MTKSTNNIVDVHIRNDVVGFSDIQKLFKILNKALKDKNEDWYKYVLRCDFIIDNDIVSERKVQIDVVQIKSKQAIRQETGIILRGHKDTFNDQIDDLFMDRDRHLFSEDYGQIADFGSRDMLLGIARAKIIWLTEQEKVIPTFKSLLIQNEKNKESKNGNQI